MKRGLNALYRQRHHHSRQSYQVSQEESNTSLSALSFGSPLNESDQGTLLQLITHMNTFISREGIFRKSGNKGRMDQLVGGLERGCFGEIILNAMYNAHDFASVLKQYFSELPEPLLLKRHLNAYLQAAGMVLFYVITAGEFGIAFQDGLQSYLQNYAQFCKCKMPFYH